jgi:hypothetical protein
MYNHLTITKKTTKQNPIHEKQPNLKKTSQPPKKCTSLSSPRNPQDKNQFIKPLKDPKNKTKIKWVTASNIHMGAPICLWSASGSGFSFHELHYPHPRVEHITL